MNDFNGRSRSVLSEKNQSTIEGLSQQTSLNESKIEKSIDRGFSLNDIFPSNSLKQTHRRNVSQNIDVLSPHYLFFAKSSQANKKIRKSLPLGKSISHSKKNISAMDNETLNSTRSHTSQSKKILYDHSKSSAELTKFKNFSIPDLQFCKNCLKEVENSYRFPDNSSIGTKIVEIFSYFVVCWEPDWTRSFQIAVCNECGKRI